MRKTAHTYRDLPYLLFEPEAGVRDAERVPLVVFLHGKHEEGGEGWSESTLDKVIEKGLPYLAAHDRLPRVAGESFPFMVVCPQAKEWWKPHHDDVLALVDEFVGNQRADPSRCYLTGISMGGFATWEIAAKSEARFAALVPVSAGVPDEAARTRNIPAWVFTGGLDEYYPAAKVQSDLFALRGRGADVTLTVDPDAAHDDAFWNDLYSRGYLYEWLLSQAGQAA